MTNPEPTAIELFTDWAKSVGCEIEITQEDDGGGYTVLYLTTPDLQMFDLTVVEDSA